jgi:DnaJ-class molecular chaperone
MINTTEAETKLPEALAANYRNSAHVSAGDRYQMCMTCFGTGGMNGQCPTCKGKGGQWVMGYQPHKGESIP